MSRARVPRPRVRARWLVEGRYRWGYTSTSVGRYGTQTIVVQVLPPGTPRVLRRCTHLTRSWAPLSGAGTAAGAPIGAAIADVSLFAAGAIVLPLLVLVGMVMARVTHPVRSRTVSASAFRSSIRASVVDDLHFARLQHLAEGLHDAETRIDAGDIRWPEYADRWERAFAALAPPR
ncbi:DUF6611 family protein [Labedella endophytica]|uniref:Uncharacterized protein n=1 Tax=Labedella endophytica TaxID=1523160 RepID=A0A433JMK6_9MICO|nr:DUF6611 family protein [Labedella endophytica]RUQ96890.1 hypothetical protein ELQ94_16710 [Labedella endophytica]